MKTLAELKGLEQDLILEIVCADNKEEMDVAINRSTGVGILIERAERELGIGG